YLWEYNSKSGCLWLSYNNIWSVFEREYHMKYNEIRSFIKNEVETTFNCTDVTPSVVCNRSISWVETTFNCKGVTPVSRYSLPSKRVETTFNCKGVTPTFWDLINIAQIEKHFNCKGVTPGKDD